MTAPQFVALDPPRELVFDFSKTTQSVQKLKLSNVSTDFVAFKVKTTAPKAYLVRPSNGVLKPSAAVDVEILLQPGHYEAQHRFLVQAAGLGKREENLTKEEWSDLGKDKIQEMRLSVAEGTKSGGSAGGGSLQERYDNIVKYTVNLERDLWKLQCDRDDLTRKAEAKAGELSFAAWQVFLILVIAIGLLQVPQYLGK